MAFARGPVAYCSADTSGAGQAGAGDRDEAGLHVASAPGEATGVIATPSGPPVRSRSGSRRRPTRKLRLPMCGCSIMQLGLTASPRLMQMSTKMGRSEDRDGASGTVWRQLWRGTTTHTTTPPTTTEPRAAPPVDGRRPTLDSARLRVLRRNPFRRGRLAPDPPSCRRAVGARIWRCARTHPGRRGRSGSCTSLAPTGGSR